MQISSWAPAFNYFRHIANSEITDHMEIPFLPFWGASILPYCTCTISHFTNGAAGPAFFTPSLILVALHVFSFVLFWLWDRVLLYSPGCPHAQSPPASVLGLQVYTSRARLLLLSLFLVAAILLGLTWHLTMGLISISLIFMRLNIFLCVYGLFAFFWRNVFLSPLPIF
jgi:hypothetical protein